MAQLRPAVAMSAALLLGCVGLFEPGSPRWEDTPVRTDSTVYHLRRIPGGYDAWAVASYTNRTGAPVHFARCTDDSAGPMYHLRRTGPDSAAKAFVGGVWACVGGVPTGVVPPGGTLTVRVWLGSTESPNAMPPIQPEERVGLFRVELALCTKAEEDSDACSPAPQSARQSNAFEIRFAGA